MSLQSVMWNSLNILPGLPEVGLVEIPHGAAPDVSRHGPAKNSDYNFDPVVDRSAREDGLAEEPVRRRQNEHDTTELQHSNAPDEVPFSSGLYSLPTPPLCFVGRLEKRAVPSP